ncbi:MAG TPA: hypothetical protein VF198_07905 [Vicinamibacterales bacterium]
MPEAPRQTGAVPASSRPVARWAVAVIAVVYGFAKLNGAQFTVLDSELDKPMGSVSGFWLVWYFFSYSHVYGGLIALVQIAGGLLVTQARFALAGALLLLPVAVNIVLVDIFYGIDLGGTLAAIVFLGLIVSIVKPHARRPFDAVVPAAGGGRRNAWRAYAPPFVLVVAAFGLTHWVANYNNRAPTAVDGVWDVEAPAGELERMFFERNRAHMVVFKDTAGNYSEHHFELDSDGRLRIWEEWLRKGPLLFEGSYTPPDRIRLARTGGAGEGELTLRRRSP